MRIYNLFICVVFAFLLVQPVISQYSAYPAISGNETTTGSGEYSTVNFTGASHFIIDAGHHIVFHQTLTSHSNGNSGITIEVRENASLTVLADNFIDTELNNFTFIIDGTVTIQNGAFKNNFIAQINEGGLFYVEDELEIGKGTTEVELAGCFYVGGKFESDDKVTLIGVGHSVTPGGIKSGGFSDEVTLQAGDFVWNGLVSGDVSTPENWWRYNGLKFVTSAILPVDTNNIIIGGNDCFRSSPVLNGILTVNGVYVLSGNSFTLGEGALLNVEGDFMNNGTFTSSRSKVKFVGASDQRIYGLNVSTFSVLELDKSNEIILEQDINVLGQIVMNSGNLYLNNSVVDLQTSGEISGEQNTSYIYCDNENGVVKAIRFVGGTAEQNPGNLGLRVTPDASYPWGMTVVERRHFSVSAVSEDRPSINRVYYVKPSTNNGSLNATVKLTFLEHEYANLLDYDMNRLAIFRNPDPATNGWQSGWVEEGGVLTDPAEFSINIDNWNQFSGLTGGISFGGELPVEMVDFFAYCDDHVVVDWETATENNAMHFEIQKSVEGLKWRTVDTVQAQGNSVFSTYYTWEDMFTNFSETSYYRLKQVDFDGYYEYYGPVSAYCNSSLEEMMVFPNPAKEYATIVLTWDASNTSAEIVISDLTGKIFGKSTMELNTGNNSKFLDVSYLNGGSYRVSILVDKQSVGFVKLVKH